MPWIFLYIIWQLLPACTHFERSERKSSWAKLDQAVKVECLEWPIQKRDFQIADIWHLDGKSPGFVVGILQKTGAKRFYWYPLSAGSKKWLASRHFLNIEAAAIIAGTANLRGEPGVLFFSNKKNKSALEFLSLSAKKLSSIGEIPRATVSEAWLLDQKDTLWILSKIHNEKIYLSHLGKHNNYRLERLEKAIFNEKVDLLSRQEVGKIFIVKSNLPKISVHSASIEDGLGGEISIPLTPAHGLESVAGISIGDSLHLAYIDGDSLVGNANLRLAKFEQNDRQSRLTEIKNFEINDTHVSEPVFVKNRVGMSLLSMQWVDAESTLALYPVSEGKALDPRYFGIFPAGSHLLSGFVDENTGDIVLIIRRKTTDRMAHELCKISGIQN